MKHFAYFNVRANFQFRPLKNKLSFQKLMRNTTVSMGLPRKPKCRVTISLTPFQPLPFWCAFITRRRLMPSPWHFCSSPRWTAAHALTSSISLDPLEPPSSAVPWMHLALKYGASTASHLVVLVRRADRLLVSPRVEPSTAEEDRATNTYQENIKVQAICVSSTATWRTKHVNCICQNNVQQYKIFDIKASFTFGFWSIALNW